MKPENILLCSVDDSKPVVKITDMGLCKLVDQTILKTFCGTPQYIAPEVIKAHRDCRVYTLKVDCWALGVILFILLSGESLKILLFLTETSIKFCVSFQAVRHSLRTGRKK